MHLSDLVLTKDHRLKRRKLARPSVKLSVRKGTMGLGKDIALEVINLTEDGIGFRAAAELLVGDEVEVTLTKPGQNRSLKFIADIRWSSEQLSEEDEWPTYVVGAKLRSRISYVDLTMLC